MHYSIRKLRQMRKERGIKYFSKMNSQTLCEKLDIPFERNKAFDTHNKDKISVPVGILAVDLISGQRVVEFQSIYKTAKYLDINPRYVYKYIESGKVVEVFGNKVRLVKNLQD